MVKIPNAKLKELKVVKEKIERLTSSIKIWKQMMKNQTCTFQSDRFRNRNVHGYGNLTFDKMLLPDLRPMVCQIERAGWRERINIPTNKQNEEMEANDERVGLQIPKWSISKQKCSRSWQSLKFGNMPTLGLQWAWVQCQHGFRLVGYQFSFSFARRPVLAACGVSSFAFFEIFEGHFVSLGRFFPPFSCRRPFMVRAR